jgi:hypothetical protein
MARPKKVKYDTKDITIPVEEWNGTTFRLYVKHLHEQRGLPYVNGKVNLENMWIKQLTDEYGKEKTKKFMELCVAEHKTSDKFPMVTIYFMKHYLLASFMPRVLNEEIKKSKLQSIREKLSEEQVNVENYF